MEVKGGTRSEADAKGTGAKTERVRKEDKLKAGQVRAEIKEGKRTIPKGEVEAFKTQMREKHKRLRERKKRKRAEKE